VSNFLKRENNFAERSLVNALSFFKEALLSENYASYDGLLQSIDPRIKTLTILFFIILVMALKNVYLILYLYILCLILALFSRIRLLFFLKRTWVFIPLFSLFIALPALFSVFSPGEALISFKIFAIKLIITKQGFDAAALFVMRVSTSISFVVLLALSTRHAQILRVLRIFKIPQVFVLTISMCYRYVYLFAGILENTYMAIKSRVGGRLHYRKGQRIVAWNIASLWQRSYQLNNDVYNAMISRGFTGEPVILEDFKIHAHDLIWLFCCLVIFVVLWMI